MKGPGVLLSSPMTCTERCEVKNLRAVASDYKVFEKFFYDEETLIIVHFYTRIAPTTFCLKHPNEVISDNFSTFTTLDLRHSNQG
jgi:hypothetical protein